MSNAAHLTSFPLGAYIANPDNSSASNEAFFENGFDSLKTLMGTAPQYLDVFVDQRLDVNQWVGNTQWNANSFAASADARTTTPVIGLPLSSTASDALSPDQAFKAFASGQYDGVLNGIVQAWASQGFTNLVFRPGWEMNLTGSNYAGDTAQMQGDWVAAFQHVYTALHSAAEQTGVSVQVVWNPGVTNYSNAGATANLYPGNNYVDVIGADAYSDIYPFSDGSTPAYHDWDTGKEEGSAAQFIADPINREHYWSLPAATKWSDDGSGGHSQSLSSLIQFAEQQGKPFAIPETGAGNSNSGSDVTDDAAYPQWLAQQLSTAQASGLPIAFVNLWDSNGGGNYAFSQAADGKPAEAASWATYFGAQQSAAATVSSTAPASTKTMGSGADVLALSVSEDAWQGDAQFTVSVDGLQIGEVQTATAARAAGQTQTVNVLGNFGAGQHTVSLNFLNDAWGGTAATDRNLYLNGAAINGQTVAGAAMVLDRGGAQSFSYVGTEAPAPTAVGSGPDSLVLSMNEDAWQGNAQFTVSVDGTQIGGVQTATAVRSLGQSQTISVMGDFGQGSHTASVNFLNDAWGGTAATDRNLFVTGATIDGTAVIGSALDLFGNGAQNFRFASAAAAAPDTLDLHVSEDALAG